jgi:cell division cycle 2-like
MALRRVSMACICIAMHDLGSAAVPSRSSTRRTRKYPTTPITTSFLEARVGSFLGEGSRGYVTMVRHRASGKTFAMKTLFPEPYEREDGDEEEEVAVFNLHALREACFMAACRGHPSLVRFHAVCRYPGVDRYCLLTEYVGPSLHDVLLTSRQGLSAATSRSRRTRRAT